MRNDNAVSKRRISLEEQQIGNETDSDFDYLLDMPLSSLTRENIAELGREADNREMDLEAMRKTTSADLWRADLEELENHI